MRVLHLLLNSFCIISHVAKILISRKTTFEKSVADGESINEKQLNMSQPSPIAQSLAVQT